MSLAHEFSTHFLRAVRFLRKSKPEEIAEKMLPEGMEVRKGSIGADIQTMTRTELKEWYPHEYGSWKNAKTRAKKYGCGFDERFNDFPAFLNVMGTRGDSENSLERIDCRGPYSPENCRWADKQDQSDNRRNVIPAVLRGVAQTIAKWAVETGQHPTTLYRRRKKGMSDEEVIRGRGEKQLFTVRDFESPWPSERRAAWEQTYLRKRLGGELPCEFYYRYANEKLKEAAAPILALGLRSLDEIEDDVIRERVRAEIERWQARIDDAKPKFWAFKAASSGLHEQKLVEEARKATRARVSRATRHDAEAEELREAFGLK